MTGLDPYKTLGVRRDADDMAIKSAYRQLVKDLHPDLNPGDSSVTERLMDVNAAYDILSNPAKRADYDLYSFHRAVDGGAAGHPTFRQALRAAFRPRYRPASAMPSRGRSLIVAAVFLATAALPLLLAYAVGLYLVVKILIWLITPASFACALSSAILAAFPKFRRHGWLGILTIVAAGVLIYWVAFPFLAAR